VRLLAQVTALTGVENGLVHCQEVPLSSSESLIWRTTVIAYQGNGQRFRPVLRS
jgi:hypothetical protein